MPGVVAEVKKVMPMRNNHRILKGLLSRDTKER